MPHETFSSNQSHETFYFAAYELENFLQKQQVSQFPFYELPSPNIFANQSEIFSCFLSGQCISLLRPIFIGFRFLKGYLESEKQMKLFGRGKRDTNTIGEISEAAIIARFLQPGYTVLAPYERTYRGQCDYFAVYCEKFNKIYLIAVDDVSITKANLRLTQTKNNQEKYVRWARDYEL